jgi:hypothetical protein
MHVQATMNSNNVKQFNATFFTSFEASSTQLVKNKLITQVGVFVLPISLVK